MDNHDPLMTGMFWAGILVASVPILLAVGVGIYVLRRYMDDRAGGDSGSERVPGPEPGYD